MTFDPKKTCDGTIEEMARSSIVVVCRGIKDRVEIRRYKGCLAFIIHHL